MSLKQVTVSTMAMSSVGILRILSQIVVVPIVARYLSPHDYGIMAVTMPFILFAMMISDAGISLSLIRSTTVTALEWSTSHWLVVSLGGILALLMCGAGYILSWLMAEPIIFPLSGVLSLSIFFQCCSTIPGAALQQSNKYSSIAIIEILAMASGLIATITLAVLNFGVWALAGQQVVMFCTKFILTSFISPFSPKLHFNFEGIIHHLRFGRDMLAGNFMNLLKQSISNTLIAKILGTHPLGLYSMASLFSELPLKIAAGPLQTVLYPRMSRFKEDSSSLRYIFIFGSRLLSVLVVPSFGMIAIAHETIFTLFLSEKWKQAGHLFLILAPTGILGAVTALRGTILMVIGKTDILLKQTFWNSLITILAVLAFSCLNIEWVSFGVCVSGLIIISIFLNQFLSLISLSAKTYFAAIITPFLMTSIAGGIFLLYERFIPSVSQGFIFAFLLGLLALIFSALIQINAIKQEILVIKKALSG